MSIAKERTQRKLRAIRAHQYQRRTSRLFRRMGTRFGKLLDRTRLAADYIFPPLVGKDFKTATDTKIFVDERRIRHINELA